MRIMSERMKEKFFTSFELRRECNFVEVGKENGDIRIE